MMPKTMNTYLHDLVPEAVLQQRTRRREGRCHLVLGYRDEHLLAKMGINCDKLGPKLVACMWDEDAALEIGGYLVVDNLAMGSPSMGGIRMLPDISPADVHNLARGMTLKNAAANLPFGGGKAGIVAAAGLSPEAHTEVIRRFARLIRRYRDIYVPGPDVGTNDADMQTIAIENGLDGAVSKPAEMGGNRIDELGAAAGGVVIALERLLEIMPRLTVLPQFARTADAGCTGNHRHHPGLRGRRRSRRPHPERTAAVRPGHRHQRPGGLPLRHLRAARGGVVRALAEARHGDRRLLPGAAQDRRRAPLHPLFHRGRQPAAGIGLLPHPGRARVQLPGGAALGRKLHEHRTHGRLVADRRGGQHLLAGPEPQGRAHPHGAGGLSP